MARRSWRNSLTWNTMTEAWDKMQGNAPKDYIPLSVTDRSTGRQPRRLGSRAIQLVLGLVCLYSLISVSSGAPTKSCDTIDEGYRCSPKITHFWGQYSLWFSVPSKVSVAPPHGCDVTFANVLSRHGGRDPTASKSAAYRSLIAEIQNTTTIYPPKFSFLKNYTYALGVDLLTDVGRQEMVNSGAHFYRRYHKLAEDNVPFVRSSGQARVVESANKWLLGLAQSLKEEPRSIDVTIPEGAAFNNTLSHETCTAFENGPDIGHAAQSLWAAKFVPPIQKRINSALGTKLSATKIIYLMDMCPFDTLTQPFARMSQFCNIFTEQEWHAYDYYETLGKFYGNGNGNPLGPTQGVGYVNELLARLTKTAVKDDTTTNHTLDSSNATFPLNRKLYADFSHDNDITGILFALGLYNQTAPLSNTTIQDTKAAHGYSAAWTVPFAARMYVEKLQCKNEPEEFVRIIVNDRVQPLSFCGGDKDGKCKLSKFVESQSFARGGGLWSRCFA